MKETDLTFCHDVPNTVPACLAAKPPAVAYCWLAFLLLRALARFWSSPAAGLFPATSREMQSSDFIVVICHRGSGGGVMATIGDEEEDAHDADDAAAADDDDDDDDDDD